MRLSKALCRSCMILVFIFLITLPFIHAKNRLENARHKVNTDVQHKKNLNKTNNSSKLNDNQAAGGFSQFLTRIRESLNWDQISKTFEDQKSVILY